MSPFYIGIQAKEESFLYNKKALVPYNKLAGTRAVIQNKYSCGATRLDVIHYIHSRILTYAFFDNGVSSPARLL